MNLHSQQSSWVSGSALLGDCAVGEKCGVRKLVGDAIDGNRPDV